MRGEEEEEYTEEEEMRARPTIRCFLKREREREKYVF